MPLSWDAPQSVEQMFEVLTKTQEALSGLCVSSVALNKLIGDYMAIIDNPVHVCLLGTTGLNQKTKQLVEGYRLVVEYMNTMTQCLDSISGDNSSEDTE